MTGKKIVFALGSMNEHEIAALKEATLRVGLSSPMRGYTVNSDMPKQLVGLAQGIQGARNNAFKALSAHWQNCEGGVLCVGIGSFIMSTGETWCIEASAIFVCGLDREPLSFATSVGTSIPMDAYVAARNAGFYTTTVGSMIAEIYGGDGADLQSTLTKGRLLRQETLTQGLVAALLQIDFESL